MAGVLLHTRLSRYEAIDTLHVSGELDVDTAPVLKRAVLGALDGQGGEFCIDLDGLTFVDSSGASAFLALHKRIGSIGRQLVLVSPRPQTLRVFELLGLHRVLEIRRPQAAGRRR